jgi:hypothetical protein
MDNEGLRARLIDAGLGRVADDIMRLTKPSIRIDCRRAEDEAALPLGSSKLGGAPDLPPGALWPSWQGISLLFIGQICLADIAPHDEEGDLPHSGLLSFFVGHSGGAAALMLSRDDPSSWMVSHFEGDLTTLVRLRPPSELREDLRLPACPATFSRQPTLPPELSREILALGLSESERLAFIEVESGEDLGFSDFASYLLGYPYDFAGSSPLIAAAASTDPSFDVSQPKNVPYLETVRDQHHRAEAEWRLLMQVSSIQEAQMDFGGGGFLYFCIPKTALSERDFSRVWVTMFFR